MRRVIYGLLITFGIFLLIMPLSIPIFTSSTDFSIFNTKWNGASSFGKVLYDNSKIIPIISPFNSIELGKKRGTLLILGPDMGYSTLEIDEIKKFLENGGTLVLIDDFGTGNQILKGLNLTARFSKVSFIDVFYSKNYNFPELVRILDPELGAGVDKLVLNVPSVILNAEGEIYTSKVALLGNNQREYPIMSELKYGKGKIVLFSDPSVFINDMFRENEKFIRNFAEYISSDVVYIDEAHHSSFNPYHMATLVIRRSFDRVKAFYVVLGVAVLALVIESGFAASLAEKSLTFLFNKLFKEEEKSLDEVINELKEEGYDEEVLRKIVREIKTGKKLGG
ncbi:DUF4350 domain-containing protein [Thermococcus barophilus]|uniref:DUF4350 domain-containing protein n=1 Tax=Thermococcus barophilus (strain DSM 11836 / MP) TaxID=391623 RepID=F0LLY9_THEBM|nr:DUF4350 domain-containing protein [Thermococcus barophilus]ADT85088.1 hypothetical protein TERMP_02114 [Thermococcus barophilus MP]